MAIVTQFPQANNIPEAAEEKIIKVTFGYDMTINEYFLILSENEKTALVVAIGTIVWNDHGTGAGKSIPKTSERIGQPFRVHKKSTPYGDCYRSKFGHSYVKSGTVWEGTPNYYNSWD